MTKYRLLTLEELKELQQEFINFLILNGIAAEDWVKIKEEDTGAADKMIELFSDVVFESIFRKVEYLEYRSQKEIQSFHCLPDKIILVGLKAEPLGNADFTSSEYINSAFNNPQENYKVFSTEKTYLKQREQELFEMTQSGCFISDGKLFKAICLAFPK